MSQPSPTRKQPPLVIGLIGGVAAGKSLVANCFKRLDAEVLDADRAAHEVLQEPEVVAATRARWGEAILDSHGRVDRGFAISDHADWPGVTAAKAAWAMGK